MEHQKDRCEGRYVGGCGYACCGEIFDTRQVAQVGHWDGFWVKKNIYNVSCEGCFGFCVSDWWGVGCQIDEETSNKLELSMVQLLICCCFVSQSLWYASSLQVTCLMKFHLDLFFLVFTKPTCSLMYPAHWNLFSMHAKFPHQSSTLHAFCSAY